MPKIRGRHVSYKAYRQDNQSMPEVEVAEWWLYELRNAAARYEYRETTEQIKRREANRDRHKPRRAG